MLMISTYNSTLSSQQKYLMDDPFPTPNPPINGLKQSNIANDRWNYQLNMLVNSLVYVAIAVLVSASVSVYLKKHRSAFATEFALLGVAFILVTLWFPTSLIANVLTFAEGLNLGLFFWAIPVFIASFGLIHIAQLLKAKQKERFTFFALLLPHLVIVSFLLGIFIIEISQPMSFL